MVEQETRDKQQLLIAAYKNIFTTEHGKIILDDLSEFCLDKNYLPDMFVVGDSHKTAYNLGSNKVMRYIKWMISRKIEKKQEKVIS